MRKTTVVFLIMLCSAVICLADSDQMETLTITTYYPSPYGVYKNLRLYPIPDAPDDSAKQPGLMYYDDTLDMLRYLNKAGEWVNVTAADSSAPAGSLSGLIKLTTNIAHAPAMPSECATTQTCSATGEGNCTCSVTSHSENGVWPCYTCSASCPSGWTLAELSSTTCTSGPPCSVTTSYSCFKD